jgi:AraC family transcriptional regulator of adaptative response/methylated-DNA-[protein]-cysteine methyltransferase
MHIATLPSADEMFDAVLRRDTSFDGIFITAVRTTGIFCRPGCPARTPLREHVEFFPSVREALAAGYRPCRRCRPMEPAGQTPEWLAPLLADLDREPARRWTDGELRARGLDPVRLRRWFLTTHGITFHAYARTRRLGVALGRLRDGADLIDTALDHGFESLSGFRDAFARVFGVAPGRGRETVQAATLRLATPLGPMVAAAVDQGVCLLEFADRRMLTTQFLRLRQRLGCIFAPGRNEHLARLEDELARYFAGTLTRFTVPLVRAGSEFQSAVWGELERIPCGETRSYEAIARALGRPKAVRAVGRANGDNRLAIVIPCHRVVRADGSLCGYGGGVWRKRWLLDHERAER